MDVALVQDSQNDIDGGERGENQQRLGGERVLEGLRSALKSAVNRRRHVEFALRRLNLFNGGPQGRSGRQVEGEGDRRKDALMVDGQRCRRRLKVSECTDGNEFAGA